MLEVGGRYPGLYTAVGTYDGRGDYYSEDQEYNIFFESGSAAGAADADGDADGAGSEDDDSDDDSDDEDGNRRRRALTGKDRSKETRGATQEGREWKREKY